MCDASNFAVGAVLRQRKEGETFKVNGNRLKPYLVGETTISSQPISLPKT